MPEVSPLRRRLAPLAVRLVALWVISVALIKLFKGNPGDLPPLIRNFAPGLLNVDLKFKLAIAIELGVSVLALLRPRWGWFGQVPMLVLFVFILVPLVLAGEESCGCFSGAIKMKPWVMLAIDGSGLLAILLTRPWSAITPKPLRFQVVLPVALVMALPWLLIRSGAPEAPVRNADGAWQLPDKLPGYATLDPEEQGWLNKPLRDTELGIWMDTDLYSQDTTWILYRVTCDHCAAELLELYNNWDQQTIYMLVRLPEADEEAYRQVDAETLPPHEEVILPTDIRWDCQAPWTLDVQAGTVVAIKGR